MKIPHDANNEPPNNWPQFLWRIRYFLLSCVILIVILIAFVVVFFRDPIISLLKKNTQVLEVLQQGNCLRINQKPEANFALFKTKWPQTDRGNPFNFFTDSNYAGKSTISYSMKQHLAVDDYYMRIAFSLNKGDIPIEESYAGIYAEWSAPPAISVDLSGYTGITFMCRLNLTQGDIRKLKVIINFAMDGVRDYTYHQYDFSTQLTNQGDKFHEIRIPFNELKPPSFSTDKSLKFDPKSIFRISFLLKKEEQEGTPDNKQEGALDIDNLVFY